MESIVRNVRDIDAGDRHALEHVVGQSLRENQQLVIQIVNVDVADPAAGSDAGATGDLPEWCNVYEGLSDEEIAEIEKIALTRADLTRPSEWRMDAAFLDTDMLNEVLKRRNANVIRHAADYLQQHSQFAISSISRYELLRGLKERGAVTQLAPFQIFCQQSLIEPVSGTILDRAADLWVLARRGGFPSRDADLIIAATALELPRVLVTGNTAHFAWIPSLQLANWRDP